MRILTLAQLIDVKACTKQVELFEATFGESVEVTEALTAEFANEFDFYWAAKLFLSVSARTEYNKMCSFAGAKYDKMRTAHLNDPDALLPSVWTIWNKTRLIAEAEYNKVCAIAFAKMYNADKRK